MKSKEFDFVPYNVNYFEDSDVILFENPISHNVYRSDDAGVSWGIVDGVPEGELMELTMHEFDRQKAYIISNGNTHWMTDDRGKTWKEFHTKAPASIFRQALTFHANDPDRIIFNAMDCTGIFCEELVRIGAIIMTEASVLTGDRQCTLQLDSRMMRKYYELIRKDVIGLWDRKSSQQDRLIWIRTGFYAWLRADSRHGGRTTGFWFRTATSRKRAVSFRNSSRS